MSTVTNNHVRELFSFFELPATAREAFDYVDFEEHYSPRFFKYRGEWYDTGDCETWSHPNQHTEEGWQGFFGETYWSAVLFRYVSSDYDADWTHVIVGYWYE